MITLYGELVDAGDAWLFTPAHRLDACAPDFGEPARLAKTDVMRVGREYGLDRIRVSPETARAAGLLQRPNLRAAMYVA